MFNNRFNSSKNDPLVEAVKAARADGDARRLAESMANDLFGVFSRKAVVREHLSDYDFALEEAYKCMKEEDKMADKDYDRDGKIETSKKEVWGSRLRAAKASGKYKGPVDEKKMWEGSGVSGEDPGMEVARKAGATQQSQTPSSTPKRTDNAAGSTISNARAATGMQEAQDDDAKRARRIKTAQKKAPKDPEFWKKVDAANEKREKKQIDEISKELAGRYIKKASRDAIQHGAGYAGSGGDYKHLRKGANRVRGIEKAVDRLAKEETQIDEISKELAGRYIKKADYRRSDSSFQSGKVYGKELATKRRTKQDVEDARKHNRDSYKREKGINTAVNKLTGRAKVAANEEIMKESIVAKLFAKHMEEQVGQVSVSPKLSAFGSAFAAARKSGQSNFSYGGKSFNTKLASSSTPKATPSMGRTSDAAASLPSSSSSRIPSMAASTPAAKPAPAPVGKRDFATTLGRDVGSGPTIKPDAPKPSVSKYDFGQNIVNPPKADTSPEPSTPTPSTPPVERGGSSNPPGSSVASTATPPSGGAITQDAQKAQATTQDAGTPKPSARLQRIGESVEVGVNKYRIV